MSKKQEYTAREKQIIWECCKQTAELEEKIDELEGSIASFFSVWAEKYPHLAKWVYDERYEALNTKYKELLEKYFALLEADDENLEADEKE